VPSLEGEFSIVTRINWCEILKSTENISTPTLCIYVCVCVCVCMYICVYVGTYIYICRYTHIHTHIYTHTHIHTFTLSYSDTMYRLGSDDILIGIYTEEYNLDFEMK